MQRVIYNSQEYNQQLQDNRYHSDNLDKLDLNLSSRLRCPNNDSSVRTIRLPLDVLEFLRSTLN